MNRLLKNVAGQRIPFGAFTSAGVVLSGVLGGIAVRTGKDADDLTDAAGAVTENGEGYYTYHPTQDETNGDFVWFGFQNSGAGMLAVTEAFITEIPGADVTLAAVQPHYAPLTAALLPPVMATCNIDNVLGHVVGDVQGNVAGTVANVLAIDPVAVNAVLDLVNGVQTGLTIRQGLRELVAALVNVSITFAQAQHRGPTQLPIAPLFPQKVRQGLLNASTALQQVLAINSSNPDPVILSNELATAAQQLAVALDAVRTSSL